MVYKNTSTGYGFIARVLHWSMALGVIALFVLGYWMRTLSYVSPYYQSAPNLHQSVGMIILGLLIFRLIWKLCNPKPKVASLTRVEHLGSVSLQWIFYLILFVIMISGYLILTLDGRGFSIFGSIQIPSVYSQKGLEQLAGKIHWVLAYLTMALVALHASAALWHHFIKKDDVLKQMTKPSHTTPPSNT